MLVKIIGGLFGSLSKEPDSSVMGEGEGWEMRQIDGQVGKERERERERVVLRGAQ